MFRTLCVPRDETRITRCRLDTLPGEHFEHLHSISRHFFTCFELAIQNEAKRFTVGLRHTCNVPLDLLNKWQGGNGAVLTALQGAPCPSRLCASAGTLRRRGKAQGRATHGLLPIAESQRQTKFTVVLGKFGKRNFPVLRLRCQRQRPGLCRAHGKNRSKGRCGIA